MKKITALLLVLVTVCGLCACGGKPESNVSVKDVFAKMKSDVAFPTEMMETDADYIKNQLGLDVNDYEEFIFAAGEDILMAEKIILVKLKDSKDADTVKTKLEKYAKEQAIVFNGYVPEQGKVAESAVVVAKGKYVYLLMSSQVNALKKIASDMI